MRSRRRNRVNEGAYIREASGEVEIAEVGGEKRDPEHRLVWCLGSRIEGLEVRVEGSRLRVWGLAFGVRGLGCSVRPGSCCRSRTGTP